MAVSGLGEMKPPRADEQLSTLLMNCQQMCMNTLRGPASIWNQKNILLGTASGIPATSNSTGTASTSSFVAPYRFSLDKLNVRIPLLPNINVGLNVDGGPKPAKTQDLPFDYHLKLNFPSNSALPPVFLQADSTSENFAELSYSDLEGEKVPCFNTGGEDRLCLPSILTTVLKEIHLDDTYQASDLLRIYFSRCTQAQLLVLKEHKIIPPHVNSAGLVRRSDAERLCTQLLHKRTNVIHPDHRSYPQINDGCLPVYHEVFGEGHGFLYSELYTSPDSECISCADCEKLFNPESFVTHSHYNQETQICHWGFSRKNWRSYLLLADDDVDDDMLENVKQSFSKILDKFKDIKHATKRERLERISGISDFNQPTQSGLTQIKRRCVRIPMKANGYQPSTDDPDRPPPEDPDRPALDYPDRVIPSTDSHLYEKHFVPNISLKATDRQLKCDPTATSEALDLTSPVQKTQTDSSETFQQERSEAVANEEEFVDVISDDDYKSDTSSVNSGNEESRCNRLTLSEKCLKEMQQIFCDVLQTAMLTTSEKDTKRHTFINLCNEIQRFL